MSVFSNLESLLKIFGTFERCRFSRIGDSISLFDGGTESAYENYALLDPQKIPGRGPDLEGLIDSALDFFALKNRSHIWPLFGGIDEVVGEILDSRGVRLDEIFHDMAADSSSMDSIEVSEAKINEVREKNLAREWADAAWYGFDSGAPAPESFVRFTASMISCPDTIVYSLTPDERQESVIAATGVLALTPGGAGIYYVATRPEFRRMGLGMSVMKRMTADARAKGFENVSLLATPSGVPLYRRCGFIDEGEVKVRVLGEFGEA